jgi:hypothetical protein
MPGLEVIITCPMGLKCEEIKDNKAYRCAWFTKLAGKDPQSEKEIEQWGCAISWLPVMLVEVSQTNRGNTDAISSMRNEIVKRQDVFNSVWNAALKSVRLPLYDVDDAKRIDIR